MGGRVCERGGREARGWVGERERGNNENAELISYYVSSTCVSLQFLDYLLALEVPDVHCIVL